MLAALLPALVTGLFGAQKAKMERSSVLAQNREQRDWQLRDTAQDREWFYADRTHDEVRQDENFWRDRGLNLADLREGRTYNEAQIDRQVASRGIDFQKLRDQAQAAGFNPLTVLGNSSMYSTERPANLSSGGMGPMTSGGGGGVSFAAGGRGYSSAVAPPVMSGASFLAEAVARGADTYFNTPPEADPLADALRHAQEEGERQRAAETRQVPRSFGYDLTEQRPFSPAAVSGIPPLSAAEQKRVSMPSGERQIGGRNMVPVRTPDGLPGNIDASIARRLDLQPFDLVSAGDWAEIVGEVGEVETAILNQSVRRAALGRGIGSAPSKTTGTRAKKTKPPKMYDPNPKGGWMDEFFR